MDNEAFTLVLIVFSIFKIFFTIFLLILLYRKHKKKKELLAYRDQTYGIIAHDLKSPYVGYFKILERLRKSISEGNVSYSNQQLDYLENSFYATKGILYNMMKWSQFTDKNDIYLPEETCLKVFLRESMDHLIAYSKLNNIDLSIKDGVNEELRIYKHYVSAILRNLVDNIIKHADSTKVEVFTSIESNKLKISIVHDGERMPEKVQMLLTKKTNSKQSINNYGTMGLGLSIILKSLKKCHGFIEIQENEKSENITVLFPIS